VSDKTETRDLAVVVAEYGLSAAKGRAILDNFADVFELVDRWEAAAKEIVVTDEKQTHIMAAARSLRLEIRERRLAVETNRKSQKEDVLREGRAIDGLANMLKGLMVPLEKYLGEQEDFAKIREEARETERREKAERLLAEQEEREAKEAAEAEEKRRAETEAENVRLKAEAKKQEKAVAIERANAEKQRAAIQKKHDEAMAAERAEREEIERKAEKERRRVAAKREKERQAQEDRMVAERIAHDKELAEAKMEAERVAAMIVCPKCGYKFEAMDSDE